MPSTRREVRDRLVVLFDAEGSFNQVLGYAPSDLASYNKVLAIYSESTSYRMDSVALRTHLFTFNLTVFVWRDENAENNLDALHEVVKSVIAANIGDTTWDHLELSADSNAYFSEISGKDFRVETHLLTVKVI